MIDKRIGIRSGHSRAAHRGDAPDISTDGTTRISEVTGRRVRAERLDPGQLGDSPAPLRAMFDHYEHHGLLSIAVTLTAVPGRKPRSIREYFEELTESRGH